MPRIASLIAVTLLSLGLIAGGCGSKQQGAAGSSKTKQSQSQKSGQKSKSGNKSASSGKSKSTGQKSSGQTSAQKKTPTVPSSSGTTTSSGNPTGSNLQAAQLYQQKCQVCHGQGGKGASAPKVDSGLKTRFHTQAQVASFIKTNMPFNDPGSLTEAQASALARYLWSMQK